MIQAVKNRPFTSGKHAEIPMLTQAASRTDIVSALTVEIAIALQHLLGMKVAAQFLRRHKISIDIALRVLLRPYQRRQYGT